MNALHDRPRQLHLGEISTGKDDMEDGNLSPAM